MPARNDETVRAAALDDTTVPATPPSGGSDPAALPDPSLLVGMRVGDYVVLGFLGAGAHGGVYVAEHAVAGHRAALKVLHRESADSPEITARFVREARVVNQARHPGIVDIYDLGTLADGRPYCVMELLRGRTLHAVVRERAPLPPEEAVAYLGAICEALEAAHRAGVIHRDVKPSNVVLLEEGLSPRLKLLDFGVAKVIAPGADGLTTRGQRLGTPSCMSPEQIRGEHVDPRADVYGLGVLLYRMLTARQPFESSDPTELERMHLEVTPPRASAVAGVPPAFDAVVARCLEKDRERRWPSARAVAEAARAALAGGAGAAARIAPAVAVHVSVKARGADLAALGAQADVADAAEAALREAGYALTLGTAGTLLGVKVIEATPAAARARRAEAVDWARALAAELARGDVAVTVCVHADDATVRDGAAGPEITGGPVCQLESWVPHTGPGFMATPAALNGLRG